MINVLQAAKDGKNIEYRPSIGNYDWVENNSPKWNFEKCDYRAKQEKKYRQFKDADEAFQEAKKHGFWVHEDNLSNYLYITFIGSCLFFTGETELMYDYALEHLTWADDGSKCGVLDEAE